MTGAPDTPPWVCSRDSWDSKSLQTRIRRELTKEVDKFARLNGYVIFGFIDHLLTSMSIRATLDEVSPFWVLYRVIRKVSYFYVRWWTLLIRNFANFILQTQNSRTFVQDTDKLSVSLDFFIQNFIKGLFDLIIREPNEYCCSVNKSFTKLRVSQTCSRKSCWILQHGGSNPCYFIS